MPYPDLVRHRMTQTPRRFRLNCCTHRQVCLLWSRLSTCREQTMTLQAKAIRSMLGETEWVRQRKSEYECEFRGHGGILYTTHTHTQTYQGRPAKSRSKIEVTDSGSRSHASQVALQLSRYHSCAHAHSHTHTHTQEYFSLSSKPPSCVFLFSLTPLLPFPSVHPCSFDWSQLGIYSNFLFNQHLSRKPCRPNTLFPLVCSGVCVEKGEWEPDCRFSAFNQCIWYHKSKACFQSNRFDYRSSQLTK